MFNIGSKYTYEHAEHYWNKISYLEVWWQKCPICCIYLAHASDQNIFKMHPAVLNTASKTAGNSKG